MSKKHPPLQVYMGLYPFLFRLLSYKSLWCLQQLIFVQSHTFYWTVISGHSKNSEFFYLVFQCFMFTIPDLFWLIWVYLYISHLFGCWEKDWNHRETCRSDRIISISSFVQEFKFSYWSDDSAETIEKIGNCGIVKVRIYQQINCGDEDTTRDYDRLKQEFKDRNR